MLYALFRVSFAKKLLDEGKFTISRPVIFLALLTLLVKIHLLNIMKY